MGVEQEVYKRDGIRAHYDKPGRCWVVDNRGRIRTIYFDVNVNSWCLQVHYTEWNGRRTGWDEVSLSVPARRAGWHLLKDLYIEEGREKDWEAFLYYQNHCMENLHRKPIADKYLPKKVLELRKLAPDSAFKMPPSQAELEKQEARKPRATRSKDKDDE